MRICCGWARKPLSLSLEQRYHPEQLINRLGPFFPDKSLASPLVWMPVWIHMDNQYVRLNSREEIELACKLACIYHNGPDNRAPFCEEDGDWHTVTRKEALLASCRPPEPESNSDGEEFGNFSSRVSLDGDPSPTAAPQKNPTPAPSNLCRKCTAPDKGGPHEAPPQTPLC